MSELKMWAVLADDTPLSLGKAVAMAGHAYGNLFEDARASHPELMAAYTGRRAPGEPVTQGQAKITVRAKNRAALLRAYDEAVAAGLPAMLVRDEGRSEVEPGTPVIVVFGPARRDDLPKFLYKLQRLDPPKKDEAVPVTGVPFETAAKEDA